MGVDAAVVIIVRQVQVYAAQTHGDVHALDGLESVVQLILLPKEGTAETLDSLGNENIAVG